MDGHLGEAHGEVHEQARAVLDYWFVDLTPQQHFAVDPVIDRDIAGRFGALRDDVVAGGAAGWRGDADTLLAAILLIDQFSRNIFRGDPRAFAEDALALELALDGIGQGWDRSLPPDRAIFMLMPLMHAEDRDVQTLSVEKFAELRLAEQIDFARRHCDVIARFGRFPSRNAILGRPSTPEEESFLRDEGAGW